MKKTLFALLVGAGLVANVYAADNQGSVIASGVNITADAAGCSLLSEEVAINLSQNVFGAYACNTDDNVIAVSTCHPNGRKGRVAVNCEVGNPAAPDDCVMTPAATAANCTVDASTTPPTYCAGTGTVSGGLTNVASTSGGAVLGSPALNCVTGGDTEAEAALAAGL